MWGKYCNLKGNIKTPRLSEDSYYRGFPLFCLIVGARLIHLDPLTLHCEFVLGNR